MAVEPKPVAPLNETATLRDQLRELGGMVLTLAQHVEALHATTAGDDMRGEIETLRANVARIVEQIGE